MVYFLIAIVLSALMVVSFVMWYDKAKKEMLEDEKDDEDENEEDK